MADSQAIAAERRVQPSFIFSVLVQGLAIFALVVAAHHWLRDLPNRAELGPRFYALRLEPVAIGPDPAAPFQFAGAWQLRSEDPRFGGWSALALDGERLLAVSDTGLIGRFGKPGASPSTIFMIELPDGPEDKSFRSNRDSEAIALDPAGRGWWIAFENRNELWLYDRGMTKALRRIELGRHRWRRNRGIEGMAESGQGLLLLLETGPTIFRTQGSRSTSLSLAGKKGRFSEATRLPDGRLFALEQYVSPTGFHNTLVEVDESPAGFAVARRLPLRLGWIDNVEGMAAEQLPGGKIRLWLITDDNFQRPMRTLLLAIDLAPERQGRPAP